MIFKSLFDQKYFIKGIENSITDEVFKVKLKSAKDNTIEDKDYFLLLDTEQSYIDELKLYSKDKKFFKSLQKEKLTCDNIQNLCAILTHLSIGLNDRMKVRGNNVNTKAFSDLKEKVQLLIDKLLLEKEVENSLYDLLK